MLCVCACAHPHARISREMYLCKDLKKKIESFVFATSLYRIRKEFHKRQQKHVEAMEKYNYELKEKNKAKKKILVFLGILINSTEPTLTP